MGRKSCGVYLVSVSSSGRHSQELAGVASIHPQGALAVRISVQRMGRRPVVSHASYPAARCACLRYSRGSSLEGTAVELRRVLPHNEGSPSASSVYGGT